MAQIWAEISKSPLNINISQVNIMTNHASQSQGIREKPNFGPKLGLNGPNLGPNFFSATLSLSPVRYHACQS